MERRTALYLGGTMIMGVLNGCQELVARETPTNNNSTITPVVVGTAQRTGHGDVTVTQAVTQSSVIQLASPDMMAVATTKGWFVLVHVHASDATPTRDEFTLVVNSTEHRPSDIGFSGSFVLDDSTYGRSYGAQAAKGWLVFRIPTQQSKLEIRIEWHDLAWRLPEEVSDVLVRRPATWSLQSFEVPDELHPGETFQVRVTVENTSNNSGTFRGALNVAGLNYAVAPYPFTVDIAAGDRGAWTKTLSVPKDYNQEKTPDFRLRTPIGHHNKSATVSVGTPGRTETPD